MNRRLRERKALLADVFKVLGNSTHGKMIKAVERQTNMVYTKYEKVVDRALRSMYFEDLEEIGEAYELERSRSGGPSKWALQCISWPSCGCWSSITTFLTGPSTGGTSSLIQMDTHSNYMAISGDCP